MKYFLPGICVLFFMACTAASDSSAEGPIAIAPADPQIRLLGRYDDRDPNQIRFAWTGSEIRAKFWGSMISISLTNEGVNGPGYYQVWVDDSSFVLRVDQDPSHHILAQDLSQDWHTLRVFKRTEAETGTGVFRGLRLAEGGYLGALEPAPNRKMLVIGNSITCGYGNEGPDQACDFSPATENGFETYAQLTAEALGAQLNNICWSGRGLYRNYDGSLYGTMPDLFNLVLPDDPALIWSPTRYFPDVILINLGTNDFGQGVPPLDTFIFAYRLFIQKLRTYAPTADIVLLTGSMMQGQALALLQDRLDRVLAYRAASGDTRVHRFDLSPQGALGYGCDWHPSVAQQRKNAAELTAFIQALRDWEIVSAAAETSL